MKDIWLAYNRGNLTATKRFFKNLYNYKRLKTRSYDMLDRSCCTVAHREGKDLNLDFQKLANLPESKLWINWLPLLN